LVLYFVQRMDQYEKIVYESGKWQSIGFIKKRILNQ